MPRGDPVDERLTLAGLLIGAPALPGHSGTSGSASLGSPAWPGLASPGRSLGRQWCRRMLPSGAGRLGKGLASRTGSSIFRPRRSICRFPQSLVFLDRASVLSRFRVPVRILSTLPSVPDGMPVLRKEDVHADLTPAALGLLSKLRRGGADAEPTIYPGVDAFSDHARTYFSNAAALCEHHNGHDFAVFGILYGLRHGLELWLKWFIQTEVLAQVVGASRRTRELPALIAVAQGFPEESTKRERQQRKDQLIKALCVMRNVDAQILYPRCQIENIGESFAREQLLKGPVDRYRLQLSWPVQVLCHDLRSLWKDAKHLVDLYSDDARLTAVYTGTGEPLSVEAIEAACDLLGTWDKDGDGFRYPCSLGGAWHMHLPPLNLRSLRKLAVSLEATVLAYEKEDIP